MHFLPSEYNIIVLPYDAGDYLANMIFHKATPSCGINDLAHVGGVMI